MRSENRFGQLETSLDIDRGLSLRALSMADAAAMTAHLHRLNDLDRYSRFFSAMSDEGITRYVDGLDWSRMVAAGAFSGARLVGIAELGWEDVSPAGPAELAVTVDSGLRKIGLGGWLVNSALDLAGDRGINRITAAWVGGNDALARIMRRLDARVWLNGSHWCGDAVIG